MQSHHLTKTFPLQRTIILITLAALNACGGGGGSSKGGGVSVANAILSPDQQAFENQEFSGGTQSLDFSFPYGGGNLVNDTNYIYADSSGGLIKSPLLAGPQTQTPTQTSLDSNLDVPIFYSNRYLAGGQVYTRAATAPRKITYVGTSVRVDYLADDNTTVVQSSQLSHFTVVPLKGYMGNTVNEFQAYAPINEWIGANNFSATAKWIAGSNYVKRQRTYLADTYFVQDCVNNPSIYTPTNGTTPFPCLTGGTIAQIFPVVQWSGPGHPGEAEQFTDGTISTVQGMPMWISTLPFPGTSQYRTYYQLGGNVYTGLLVKSGTIEQFSMTDGSITNYAISMNQIAVSSVQQGVITGSSVVGSQSGNGNTKSSSDLFGIGGHGVNGSIAPADLLSHYFVPTNLSGAGQTIVIIDAPASGDVADDLNVYSQFFGLPQCTASNPCFQHIDLSNVAPVDPNYDFGAEVELDTQMVHAIAPKANIVLITAASSSSSDLAAAVVYAESIPNVTAVTMSYGISDAPPIASATEIEPAEYLASDQVFASGQSNLGMIFFASSGDAANYAYSTPAGFSYPAASPYVTAVGGTSINSVTWGKGSNSEIGWQFSGGGYAIGFALPAWQASYPGVGGLNAYRAVPDVSAVADNQRSALSIYYKQQWLMAGGTSASSPIWAGFSALFGEYLSSKGQSLPALIKNTPGGFNGLLYQTRMAQSVTPGLIDITVGSNNISPSACYVCSAVPGFDDVTGLGVPNLTNFLANF